MSRYAVFMVTLGIVGLTGLGSLEAQVREKTTVAVEHFEASAGLGDLAQQVSDMLTARWVQHFTLLTRKDMDAVLAEHRLGFSDGMQHVAEFGKMLGAQKIILGRVDSVAFSKAVHISLWMVDVEKASLDFQEVADLVPRERLKEATDLLSEVILGRVPIRGRIVEAKEDKARINLGSADNLRVGTLLEVLKESEYGWITVGHLSVVSADAYSAQTAVARQEEPFQKGQWVQTSANEAHVDTLRNQLYVLGQKERQRLGRIAEQMKRIEDERLRAQQIELERAERMAQEQHRLDQMRMRVERAEEARKLPGPRLRLGAGYFEPADSDFKDTYYGEGTDLKLGDPSFYSWTVFLLSHPYFRGYLKGTYFSREESEPKQEWETPMERKIFRSALGARLQIPIPVPQITVNPYAGGGGTYSYMKDAETDEGLGGMGYEYFFGAALVFRNSIGVFVERIKEISSVGTDQAKEADIGGTSVMMGVEIWW
ncbi:MAG: CsgG/HfaB family protein [Candidatus Latescibacterota bacterium]